MNLNGSLAGLGILTMALFPIALVAVAGVLLAIPLLLPLWLIRLVRRRSSARTGIEQALRDPAHRVDPV